MTIESNRYRETREKLKQDPIILLMAADIPNMGALRVTGSVHEDDTPTFDFMSRALDEYKARGGEIPTHIGGPAQAIIALIKER